MHKKLFSPIHSLISNIAFGAYHIFFGIITHSDWLFTIGIYYAILSIVRFAVLQIKKENGFLTKFVGIMLILLSLSLVGTVILTIARDKGIVMHEIVMIALAAYSFIKITLAIFNLIKARKSSSAKLITLRNISFAEACVSIFTLQRSMLVSFGDMPKSDIRIFNAACGSAVCAIVFLLGLNLLRNKKILFSALNR